MTRGARKGSSQGTPKAVKKPFNPASCGECKEVVEDEMPGFQCETCLTWYHRHCTEVSKALYDLLCTNRDSGISWSCASCKNGKKKIFQMLTEKIEGLHETINELKIELKKSLNKVDTIESSFEERVKGIVLEEREKENRKDNLIIYNVPESKSMNEKDRTEDEGKVQEIIKHFLPGSNSDHTVVDFFRLGRDKNPDKTRPIKVTLKKNANIPGKVLKAIKTTSVLAHMPNIKFSPDRSKSEREQYQVLVKELRNRKEAGETDIMIRDLKIVKRPPGPILAGSASNSN